MVTVLFWQTAIFVVVFMVTATFRLISEADLNQNSMKSLNIDGKQILLANINGTYYAMGNMCTHRGCPLSSGILKGDVVECVCHGSVFDLKTGQALRGPAKAAEPKYETKVENLKVYISI